LQKKNVRKKSSKGKMFEDKSLHVYEKLEEKKYLRGKARKK